MLSRAVTCVPFLVLTTMLSSPGVEPLPSPSAQDITSWTIAAEQGDATAQYNLGRAYMPLGQHRYPECRPRLTQRQPGVLPYVYDP